MEDEIDTANLEESLLSIPSAERDETEEEGEPRNDRNANVAAKEGDPWVAMKEIMKGAVPQIVVIFSKTSTTVTDTAVVGQLGTDELAAAAFATMWIQVTAVIIWVGCGDAMIALTSQAIGAENRALAGVWLQIGLVAAMILAVPIGLSWFFIGDLLDAVVLKLPGMGGQNEHVIHLASIFGRLSTIWLIPDAMTSCFCQWLNGLDVVAATVPIHVFFAFFNLFANLILVHGVYIGPVLIGGLGFSGSPLATGLTTICRLVTLVLYMRPRLHKQVWSGFKISSFSKERITTFLGQSIPNALVAVLEQVQFLLMTVLIAEFGEAELAAHSAMMNMFDLFSGAIYGMMDGGSMKIGKELGAGRPKMAQALSRYLFLIMGSIGVIVTTLFLSLENVVGYLFSTDRDVVHYAKQLSVLSGTAYLFVTVTFAAYSILQGQGRPNKAVAAMFFGIWGVGVPVSYILGFVAKCSTFCGFLGVWEGSIIGYCIMTVIMCVQVYFSDWEELSHEARIRSEVDDNTVSTTLTPPAPGSITRSPRLFLTRTSQSRSRASVLDSPRSAQT